MLAGLTRNFLLSLSLAAASISLVAAGGCFDPDTSPFDPIDWSHCVKISNDHEMYMYYTPLEDTVLIGFHALQDTEGWSALGINGNGGMKGATFIVVRQDDDGTWIAEDRFAMDYTMPTLDEQQDVKLLFAEQEDGQTAWGVIVPQSSCDSDGNDYDIVDRYTSMLWAVGSSHAFGYHIQRGQFQANLMHAPEEPANTDGLASIELRMPDVDVVLGEGGEDPTNPYICSFFDLHEIAASEGFSANDKIHATRFSPILDPESKQYVHHMILFSCSSDADLGSVEHLKIIPECVSMPEDCIEMKWPWAVGGRDTIFPDGIGLPLGGTLNRFLVLQMHYYNPTLDEGIVDSSGVKFYYTTDLQEEEAGVMQLVGATNPWQGRDPLPTGKESVTVSFTTPSECTQSAWTQPLNILGIGHHLHTYGIYQEITIVRNGVNIGALRPEKYYDFMHQSMEEPMPSIRQLLPGDQITQNCVYDTTNAPGDVVEFGDKTQNEMCYTAIYYYPRQSDDSFGAMPAWFDTATCSESATSAEFQAAGLSLCAESLYSDVAAFFRFWGNDAPSFDLLTVCNGGDLFPLLLEHPYLCPTECQATSTCTAEEIAMQAAGVCEYICNEMGLSHYPNTTNIEPFEYGNWGCEPSYYTIPSTPDAPACEAKGTSSLDAIEVSGIDLKGVSNSNVTGGTQTEDSSSTETGGDSIGSNAGGTGDASPTDTATDSTGTVTVNNSNSSSARMALAPASVVSISTILVLLCL